MADVVVALVSGAITLAGIFLAWVLGRPARRLADENARLDRESQERQDVNRARQELNEVQREEIEMLKSRLAEIEAQNKDLQAKVAAYEQRPPRRSQ